MCPAISFSSSLIALLVLERGSLLQTCRNCNEGTRHSVEKASYNFISTLSQTHCTNLTSLDWPARSSAVADLKFERDTGGRISEA